MQSYDREDFAFALGGNDDGAAGRFEERILAGADRIGRATLTCRLQFYRAMLGERGFHLRSRGDSFYPPVFGRPGNSDRDVARGWS